MNPSSLFGLTEHLAQLSKHGDPLEVLDATVDFEYFRGWLVEGPGYCNGAKGGRPPFDSVSMFKALILQAQHNLSDARMEFMIRDRLSWMRFLDFNFSLAARLEDLSLTGTANIRGTGNSLDNEITGNSGNNPLLGGADAADLLIGAAGNDMLDGGAGADRMFGQSGDDTYVVDNVGDRAIERIGFGTDTVQTSISFRLQLGIERLELTGDANLSSTGNVFNNSLTGNAGDNRLLGGGGVDTLIGGDSNDLLAGQSGNDIMQGGYGNDLLAGSIGVDRYEGCAGIDRLFELVGQGSDTFVSPLEWTGTSFMDLK
jgi:hypothetical protein